MLQNELHPVPGSRKGIRRKGRGISAGQGKTAGRGTKGQKSRKGGSINSRFEGGQTPIHKRLPKLKGFNNLRFGQIDFQCINVSKLNIFDGQTVSILDFFEKGLLSKKGIPCKILGHGDITAKVNIKVNKISASAKTKIEKAGGSVELI